MWNQLPARILCHCLLFASTRDVANGLRVWRILEKADSRNALWKLLYVRDWRAELSCPCDDFDTSNKSWAMCYAQRRRVLHNWATRYFRLSIFKTVLVMEITALAASRHGVLVGGRGGEVALFDPSADRVVRQVQVANPGRIVKIVLRRMDGNVICVVDSTTTIHVLRLPTLERTCQNFKASVGTTVLGVEFVGEFVVIWGWDGIGPPDVVPSKVQITAFDFRTSKVTSHVILNNTIPMLTVIAFDPNDAKLAYLSHGPCFSQIDLLRLDTGQVVGQIPLTNKQGQLVCFPQALLPLVGGHVMVQCDVSGRAHTQELFTLDSKSCTIAARITIADNLCNQLSRPCKHNWRSVRTRGQLVVADVGGDCSSDSVGGLDLAILENQSLHLQAHWHLPFGLVTHWDVTTTCFYGVERHADQCQYLVGLDFSG